MKRNSQRLYDFLERWWGAVLVVGSLIAAVLVLAIGMMQSVWFDEAYSISIAAHPINELISLTAADVHPPLYYLLLKGWMALLGDGELALRALGAVFGGLIVLVGGLLTKRVFGVRAALIVVPLLVFSPLLLRYGFEIRMYAMATLIGLLATWVLVAATEARRNSWVLWATYAILVALGMYTVYYIALLWIAHVVWLLYLVVKKKSKFQWRWVVTYAGAAALFIPWIPSFFSQFSNGALANISQPLTVENLIGILSFGTVYYPTWQLGALGAFTIVLLVGALIWLGGKAYRTATQKQRQLLALFVAYLAVPILVIMVFSLFRPLYVERYLVPVTVGGYIVLAAALALVSQKYKAKVAVIFAGFLIAIIAGSAHLLSVGNFNFQRLQRPAVNQIAEYIGECKDGEVVLAADPYVATELGYYVGDVCRVRFYEPSPTLGGGYAPLSGSVNQVTSTQEVAGSTVIRYVHYGEAQLEMPVGYSQSAHMEVNGLTVSTWRQS